MRMTFVYGVFQLWLVLRLSYNEAVVFKFTNAVCESYNKSWIIIHECRLKAISRNKTIFNLNGTFLHPAKDISLKIQIYKKANGYKPWLFKANIDVCRFLERPYNPFAKIIYSWFKEFANFNHSCPYNGSALIQDFYLRSELVRVPLPTGDYLCEMNFFFDKKLQLVTKVYAHYLEDLKDI